MLAERRFQKDLDSLQSNLSRLMADFNDIVKAKGENLKNEIVKEIPEAELARLKESIEDLGQRAKQAGTQVQNQIEEHPVVAVCAALGVGFLLGKLIGLGKR